MPEPVLRLATWNIHMGVGLDGRRDLERIGQVIRDMAADLVGLQEVDNHTSTTGNDLDRLQVQTTMTVIAGPTMQRSEGDYGNALLTRLPVLDVERYDLSVSHREPRGLLIAHLDGGAGRLQVAVTHLGLRAGERRRQVRHLIDHLSPRRSAPMILMGDFNEWLFLGRPLRWLHSHFGPVRSPPTFPSRWPLLRLDHILAAPPESLRSIQTFTTPPADVASDHLPLVADYILKT